MWQRLKRYWHKCDGSTGLFLLWLIGIEPIEWEEEE